MLTIDLALATHTAEGIQRVARMITSPIEGVRYVVSWQNHMNAPIPEVLASRIDVSILRFDRLGQSYNRNNALANCSADIVIMCDDDLKVFTDGIIKLREIFQQNPSVDVVTFVSEHGDMKRFPKEEIKLSGNLPKGYYTTGFEIAMRRTSAGFLRCCPELGLGSKELHGGEDEMFLMSAIKRGLDCRFFPVKVFAHPHESTGTKSKLTKYNIKASGCIMALSYPYTIPARILLKAYRLAKAKQAGFLPALYYLTIGAIKAPGVLRRNHNTLW